ncbi:sigma-70 family RNA polymerase sigma factor [Petroclostridium sp. X23]|uniref:RNA polymerase sigma factor n=1 Tax=Petroclostridium sp. X23 TaxID=3045146 RepID=UPI0024ADEA01|nr:sigma-70 family RNA polymerase sigma factor [Petroclostridium sp. X23]WHH59938.1 sigma-70 family RNA polymerase sigma factor [Petroclostridium sp. X23]
MSQEKMMVQKCKGGDMAAFEQLIENYQKKVFNIAYRILGNPDDASDMAQEVFLKVYKSISNFKEESSLSTWIYRIATNVCLDEVRKRKKAAVVSINSTIQLEDGEINVQMEDEGPGPDQLVEEKELREEVRKAIESLNDEHKVAIILRDINGFSYEEISNILQCSLGTVKSRINRARNALKNILLKERNFSNHISSN